MDLTSKAKILFKLSLSSLAVVVSIVGILLITGIIQGLLGLELGRQGQRYLVVLIYGLTPFISYLVLEKGFELESRAIPEKIVFSVLLSVSAVPLAALTPVTALAMVAAETIEKN